MTYQEIKKIAKKYDGWIEGSKSDFTVRFPTPHQKDQFLREVGAKRLDTPKST